MRIPCWHRTTSLPTRSKVMNLILMTNNKVPVKPRHTNERTNGIKSSQDRRGTNGWWEAVPLLFTTLPSESHSCDGNYSNSSQWMTMSGWALLLSTYWNIAGDEIRTYLYICIGVICTYLYAIARHEHIYQQELTFFRNCLPRTLFSGTTMKRSHLILNQYPPFWG